MLTFTLIALVHILAGLIIALRVFRPRNRTDWLLITGLISFITFYMVPVALGSLTGYMNTYVLFAGVICAIVAAVASYVTTKASHQAVQWATPFFKGRSWPEWPILFVGVLCVTLIATAGAIYPARTWDAPAYHMSNPISWHRTGKFVLESFGCKELSEQLVSAECAPNVKAVVPFAIMLFTQSTHGTSLAQFPFFLLLLITVRALALRLGTKTWLATLAAVCVISIPELFLQSLEAYSDLMFVSGQMAVVWAIMYLWTEKLGWRPLFLASIGFGIMAGAKAAFLASGAVLGMLFGLILLWKCWATNRKHIAFYVALGLLFTIVSVAATGGPWFWHAWQKYQNPVYPFELAVGSNVIFEGRYQPTMNNEMVKNFTGAEGKQAYWNTLRELWREISFSNWAGGLGAVMFILGLPALILFSVRGMWGDFNAPARRILVIAAVLLTVASPTLAISRFTLYQPVVAILAVTWLSSIFPLGFRGLVSVMLSGLALYNVFMILPSIQYRRRPAELVFFNLLSGHLPSVQKDVYPDQYTALDYWREEISRPGLKLGLPPTEVAVWLAYVPRSPADAIRFRNPTGLHDAAQWHRELINAGTTHIYMQTGNPGFEVALANPALFKLLIRRLDGQFGPIWSMGLVPWPEDALFELQGRSANED